MVLSDFSITHPDFRFSILASDISTRILETAKAAIYPEERTDIIPLSIKKSTDEKQKSSHVFGTNQSPIAFHGVISTDQFHGMRILELQKKWILSLP